MYDFICGLCYLDYYLEDGGHTSMSYATKDKLNQYYGEFPLSEFSELELTEEGSDRVKYNNYFSGVGTPGSLLQNMAYTETKSEVFKTLKEVKQFKKTITSTVNNEDGSTEEIELEQTYSHLYQYEDDTLVFSFNSCNYSEPPLLH